MLRQVGHSSQQHLQAKKLIPGGAPQPRIQPISSQHHYWQLLLIVCQNKVILGPYTKIKSLSTTHTKNKSIREPYNEIKTISISNTEIKLISISHTDIKPVSTTQVRTSQFSSLHKSQSFSARTQKSTSIQTTDTKTKSTDTHTKNKSFSTRTQKQSQF